MEDFLFDLLDFMKKPSVAETFVDILLCAVPIWLAVMIGLVIGWSWRPRWSGLIFLGLRSKLRFLWTLPPGLGARRLWLAFTALSAFSIAQRLWVRFNEKAILSSSDIVLTDDSDDLIRSYSEDEDRDKTVITEKDLEHLWCFTEGRFEEIDWQTMMNRSTSSFSYQAWCHEPKTGPTVYRTRTIFEDATPEIVRDFFWDDEFRPKWDPMLVYFKTMEMFPSSGTMVVHWIRKFPFFCSDREYIIGRRIWEAGNIYYCITKGVPYPGIPIRSKPRRVDLYFSSWSITPWESRKGDGRLSACEVNLVHYEDMGIPKDVAKLGVRHGMWGTVKKLHTGLRAYQETRERSVPASISVLDSYTTTTISQQDAVIPSSALVFTLEEKSEGLVGRESRREPGLDWRWLALGGLIALACGLHAGSVRKALLLVGPRSRK